MQNRYTGDIGDYVKYGLLRALVGDRKLGVAWYLYPDEAHNEDGKHTNYLVQPEEWRGLDSELYDGLKNVVLSGHRTINAIEQSGLLPNAVFANEVLQAPPCSVPDRRVWRTDWFKRVLSKLDQCEIVFADPDNGFCLDEKFRPGRVKDWKRLPVQEAKELSSGRPAILYHHNSRYPGGHRLEIEHWMERLPGCTHALYWRRYSNRTFFVVNPTPAIERDLERFARRWRHGDELIQIS